MNIKDYWTLHRDTRLSEGRALLFLFYISVTCWPRMKKRYYDSCHWWLAGLWCFNATFNKIPENFGGQFYWWRKPEYPKETTDLSQDTDKLNHIILHREHLTWVGFELTTLVVRCSDCIGRCKSNYHSIATTTVSCHWWSQRTVL